MAAQLEEDFLIVVDPVSRKLKIPRSAVYETRAFNRTTPPSLCMLFMNGRCRQGLQCHQAHANSDVVHQLRAEALKIPSCCAAHGDVAVGKEFDTFSVTIVISSDTNIALGVEHFAATAGLTALLSQPVEKKDEGHVTYPATLCRLHAYDRCRYAEDCRFLHLCRGVVAEHPYIIPRDLQVPSYKQRTPPSYYTSVQLHQPWASDGLIRPDNLDASWSTVEQSTPPGTPTNLASGNGSFRFVPPSTSEPHCYAHAPYSPKLIPWNLEEEWVC